MKILQKFTFKETTRRFITYIIYAIFTCYTLYKLITEPSAAGKVCYALILILFMGVALWAEYLRILYQKMISSLTIECDTQKARHYQQLVKKRDLFKNYHHPLLIFDTLYYQDINDPNTCLSILEQNDKMFRSSLDYLLIRNYTYFYSYYRLSNRSKVKKYYPEVMKLKGAKVKGSKVNPLYNWELIEAIYQFSLKDYKKSLAAFQNVNTQNFNHREQSQYHLAFGQVYRELQDKENAKLHFQKVIEIAGNLSYGKEAAVFLKKL